MRIFYSAKLAEQRKLKADIHLEKTVSIPALQQLKGVKLDSVTLKLPPEADGTNLRGMITLPNWSILTMGLGNVTLNAWAGKVLVGSATILDVVLPPGNTTMPFYGTLDVKALVSNLGAVIASQSRALATGAVELGVSGNSTASRISCFCESIPPISWYATSGFSSWPNIAIEESASGGRMSTSALECRCRATLEDGFSNSLSSVLRIRTT